MAVEASNYTTSTDYRTIAHAVANVTNFPEEYVEQSGLDVTLVPPEYWSNGWQVKNASLLQPGDYLLLGPNDKSHAINFLLTRCIGSIGNAVFLQAPRRSDIARESLLQLFDKDIHPRWSARIDFAIEAQAKPNLPTLESFMRPTFPHGPYEQSDEPLCRTKITKKGLSNIQIEINEPPYTTDWLDPTAVKAPKITRRKSGIVVGGKNDIHINDDLWLENDVLITHGPIPILVSDFHSKATVHLPLLAVLGLIPNVKPTVDWLDAHHDKYYLDELPKKLRFRKPPQTLREALAITRKINVGWAAQFLNAYIYDIVDGTARTDSMPGAYATPLFQYKHPLGRKHDGQPHVLVYDLDLAVPYVTEQYGQTKLRMKNKLAEYMNFLIRQGLAASNYDAALLYTSPYWSFDTHACRAALQATVDQLLS